MYVSLEDRGQSVTGSNGFITSVIASILYKKHDATHSGTVGDGMHL